MPTKSPQIAETFGEYHPGLSRNLSPVMDEYDDEKTTADEYEVTVRTLRQWRREGKGPPWTRKGRKVIYHRQRKREHLAKHTYDPEK